MCTGSQVTNLGSNIMELGALRKQTNILLDAKCTAIMFFQIKYRKRKVSQHQTFIKAEAVIFITGQIILDFKKLLFDLKICIKKYV